MDPQANSTSLFVNPKELEYSVLECIQGKASLKQVILPTTHPYLDIAPACIRLSEMESNSSDVNTPYFLNDAIQKTQDYRFIIIDCPPSLSLLTINALVASTHLIIPAQAEKFSIDGMNNLQETVEKIRKRINPKLIVLGILMTRLKPKTILNKTVAPLISEYFSVFNTVITEGVSIGESHLAQKTIYEYAPNSKQAKEYQDFTEEVYEEITKF